MRALRNGVAVAVILLLGACAPSYYRQAQSLARSGDHAGAIPLYYQQLAAAPASHAAWREMGVSFYEQGDYEHAEEALKQAAAMRAEARTQLYLGLVLEHRGESAPALRAYGYALGLSPRGTTRDLLEARIAELNARLIRDEAQRAVAHEKELGAATVPDSTVAVVEFADAGLPPELSPLTRGLAEFTALDLGKVGALRVVDRLKIAAIRAELSLSQTGFADPATAPRIGHLVGGRRIVTGSLLGVGAGGVRLDGAIVDTADKSVTTAEPSEGPLTEILRVQKKFVFDVLAAMDVEVSPAERDAIQAVPTESYLAFLAYCRGLQLQDRDDLAGAQREFRQAVAADGGFGAAAKQYRAVSTRLDNGLGPNADVGSFSAVLGAAATRELANGDLGGFPATITGWNGFLPLATDQDTWDQFSDSPPHRRFQASVDVFVRGDFDGQP